MRRLILAMTAVLLLGGCVGGVDLCDHSALQDPPLGSSVPKNR